MWQEEIERACPIIPVLEKQTCGVCLGTIRVVCRELPCQHAYCPHCIDPWLREQRNCPQCRRPVRAPNVVQPGRRPLRQPVLRQPPNDVEQRVLHGRYYATLDGHLVRDPHLDRALDRRQRGKTIAIGFALAAVCMGTMVLLHRLACPQLRPLFPLCAIPFVWAFGTFTP